jgi:hypothetical protein
VSALTVVAVAINQKSLANLSLGRIGKQAVRVNLTLNPDTYTALKVRLDKGLRILMFSLKAVFLLENADYEAVAARCWPNRCTTITI